MKEILILILAFSLVISNQEEGNFTLNLDNLDSFFESHNPLMIMFYTPWCEKCKELAPEFTSAGELGLKHNPPFYLASIDASKHRNISEKYKITEVPSIILLRKGKNPTFYDSYDNAFDIINFIEKKILPPSLILKTKKEVKNEIHRNNTIVIFGGQENSSEFKVFFEVASLLEEVSYFHTSYEVLNDVIKNKSKSSPLLVLFKTFDEKIDVFIDNFELKSIAKFIYANYLPHVLDMNQKNIDAVFNRGKEAMFLFINKSKPGVENIIKKYYKFAENNKNEMSFFLTGVSNGNEIKVAQYLKVSESDLPRLEIFRPNQADLARYIYSKPISDYLTFDEFLQDYRSNKIKRFFRSEEIPDSQESLVTKIVGKNWDDFVIKSKKDVLVKFIMPNCDPCVKMEPIYKEVAEKMKKYSENISIAEIDIYKNDIPDGNVQTVPHIRLYPSKAKKKPFDLPYNGTKNIESIMSFIKEKASFKVEFTNEDTKSQQPSSDL